MFVVSMLPVVRVLVVVVALCLMCVVCVAFCYLDVLYVFVCATVCLWC